MNTQILQVIPNQINSCDTIEAKNITTDDIFLIKDKIKGKVVHIITCRRASDVEKEWMFLDIVSGICDRSVKQTAEEIFKLWSNNYDVQIIKSS